jgi:hypothetical protein
MLTEVTFCLTCYLTVLAIEYLPREAFRLAAQAYGRSFRDLLLIAPVEGLVQPRQLLFGARCAVMPFASGAMAARRLGHGAGGAHQRAE